MLQRTAPKVGFACLLALATVTAASAADRVRHKGEHRHHGAFIKIKQVNKIRNVTKIAYGTVARPYGRYSGDVSVVSVPGVGQYSYGTLTRRLDVTTGIPNAKIIDVKSAVSRSACSMEAGVCVIRP